MVAGRPHFARFDVWTDAGPEAVPLYRIAENVSSSNSHALGRILRKAGWKVELRERPREEAPE